MCKGCGWAFCDCEEYAHNTCSDCSLGFCQDCLQCGDCNADNECHGSDCPYKCRACNDFICESCAADRLRKCEHCDRSFCESCALADMGERDSCGKEACVIIDCYSGEGVSACLVLCNCDGEDRRLCSGCRPNLDQDQLAPTARPRAVTAGRGYP